MGMKEELKGFQKKYLRGLAHGLKPSILIGQKGLTDSMITAIDQEFNLHELIKVKFNDFKEKDQKQAIMETIVERTGCCPVGMIGHTVVIYRRHHDPEKRKIRLPVKAAS
jgi:RNA-binding protein